MKYDAYLASINCYVNKDGSVYSFHKGYNRMVKHNTWHDKDGYLRMRIHGKDYRHNRIVALAFIPNPDNLPVVDHINHKRDDDRIENLRWATVKQNAYNLSPTKLHKAISVRRVDDKKEYERQYNKLRRVKQLNLRKPDKTKTTTRVLSDEEYDLLLPLSPDKRYLIYQTFKDGSFLKNKLSGE